MNIYNRSAIAFASEKTAGAAPLFGSPIGSTFFVKAATTPNLMANAESVSHEDLVVCAAKGQEYTARDAVEAALFRGDLNPIWTAFLHRVAAEKHSDEQEIDLDEDAIDAAAERFRYNHDLITAEETEQWLATRDLDLDDFGSYFARQVAAETLGDNVPAEIFEYRTAPDETRQLFLVELILSDELERITNALAWRLAAVAAAAESDADAIATERKLFLARSGLTESDLPEWLASLRRDSNWLDQTLNMESEFRRRRDSLLTPQTRQREMSQLRLPLTRFESEVIELESKDAAQEALFCVKHDGMSMEEVAMEGRYPFKVISFLQEDIPQELQQKFLSVSPGDVLDPISRGDGFELYRVTSKKEPHGDDSAVQERIDHLLLSRHFADLTSRHVENRLFMTNAKQ